MTRFSGLEAGCCNRSSNGCGCGCGCNGRNNGVLGTSNSSCGSSCPNSSFSSRNSRFCCGGNNSCCCGNNNGVLGTSTNSCCGNSNSNVKGSIQIVCVDENCNGVCNCTFQLTKSDGCQECINLGNCDTSPVICIPCGTNVLENTSVPAGFETLPGCIFCEVGSDSCGRTTVTVASEGVPENQLSVRRECGVSIITCKLKRVAGTGCGNGCDCAGL